MADRDILFRIGVGAHPETPKRLGELAEAVQRTMRQVNASIASVGAAARRSAGEVAAAVATIPAAPEPATVPRFASGGPAPTVFGSGRSVTGDTGARFAPARPLVAGLDAPRATIEQRPAVAYTAAAKAPSADRSPSPSSEESFRIGPFPEAEAATASDRLSALREDLQQSAQAAAGLRGELQGLPFGELIARGNEFSESMAGIDKEIQAIERSQRRTFRGIVSSASEAGEGLGQFASGLALLGADSESVIKLVESLQTIKGVSDTFVGAGKIIASVTQGLSLLTDRSEDAADKQSLLAERQRLVSLEGRELALAFREQALAAERSGTATEAQIRALRQLAVDLDKATRETRELDRAQDDLRSNPPPRGGGIVAPGFGGGGRGLVGRLIGNAGRNLASELTDSPLAQDAIGEGADFLGDQIQGGGAKRLLGRLGGLRGVGGIAGRVALGAGTLASAAALAKGIYDVAAGGGTLDDSSATGRFFGSVGTNRTLANAERLFQRTSPFGRENTSTQLADSYDAVDRAQARLDEARQREQDGLLGRQYAAADLRVEQQLSDRRLSDSSDQRAFAVESGSLSQVQATRIGAAAEARELGKSLSDIRDYQRGIATDEEAYLAALERAQTVSERLVGAQKAQQDALREEFSLRRELNATITQGIQARIDLIGKEAGSIRELGKTAENSLLSSAERFARLSDEQQQEAIKAQKIAQAGGKLTDKQQDLLSSIGTSEATDAVRRQNLAEARQKGFFQTFGGSEQRLAAASRQSAQQDRAAELGQARANLGRTIREAGIDGRITTEDRQRIAGARASLAEVTDRQRLSREREQSDRLRQRGFGEQANMRDAGRLAQLGGEQARLQVAVTTQQQLSIQLQTNERAVVAAVQRTIAENQRGQTERIRKLLQEGLNRTKTELREQFEKNQQLTTSQGQNTRPS